MNNMKMNVKEIDRLNQWLARLNSNNIKTFDVVQLETTTNGIGTTITARVTDLIDNTCGYWCNLTQNNDW